MASTPLQLESVSGTELQDLINERARFKQRSHDTHTQTHQPELERATSNLSSQIDIVLLGDSMLERFKTTGKDTQIGQLQYPHLFNAGVGGDKIVNIFYRLKSGLLALLQANHPKLVVIQMGTNNLQPRRPLHSLDLENYHLLLQALLRFLPAPTQILVTGLFRRTDVNEQYVRQSNMELEQLVKTINTQGNHRIHWMEPPAEIQLEHLADNVHLNQCGYQIWDRILYTRIQQLLTVE